MASVNFFDCPKRGKAVEGDSEALCGEESFLEWVFTRWTMRMFMNHAWLGNLTVVTDALQRALLFGRSQHLSDQYLLGSQNPGQMSVGSAGKLLLYTRHLPVARFSAAAYLYNCPSEMSFRVAAPERATIFIK